MLTVPFTKTAIAARAFECYAPRLWNGLPRALRDCVPVEGYNASFVDKFKRLLKTTLFSAAFSDVAT